VFSTQDVCVVRCPSKYIARVAGFLPLILFGQRPFLSRNLEQALKTSGRFCPGPSACVGVVAPVVGTCLPILGHYAFASLGHSGLFALVPSKERGRIRWESSRWVVGGLQDDCRSLTVPFPRPGLEEGGNFRICTHIVR